jgi:transcriptional regulator with PAS, ATPase and Fis domain
VTEKPHAGHTTEVDPRVSSRGDATPKRPEAYFLIVRSEDGAATRVLEVAIGDSITVGRSPSATVYVDSPRVSREHARIERRHEGLVIRDLGSRNGTWIGGDRLRGGERALGAGDVVALPPLSIVVASAAGAQRTRGPAPSAGELPGFIVADPAMISVFQVVQRLASLTTTVLVLGETGVGKEIVAEQLHRRSPRAAKPFVSLSCAALPENLAEAELFGYERGAFTGADRRKIGYIEAAHEGTLMLDEIGELGPTLQAKLLRVLETRRLARLGSTQEVPVDIRVVSATCRDLKAAVAAGTFRQDLFFRLSTFSLEVPPLRERPSEIELLADLFAKDVARRAGESPRSISADAVLALQSYEWPGNVRELRNAIEHAHVLASGDRIERAHLPPDVRDAAPAAAPLPASAKMEERIADVERRTIAEALAACDGNRTRTAERLGISRRALIYKLAKHGLR